jgi:hypothetical protein
MLRDVYIVIRVDEDKNKIMKVCDSEWLAMKRLSYFNTAFPMFEFEIKQYRIDISDFE